MWVDKNLCFPENIEKMGQDVSENFLHSMKALFQITYKSVAQFPEGDMTIFNYERKKGPLSFKSVEDYMDLITKQFVSYLRKVPYEALVEEKLTNSVIRGEEIYKVSCPCELEFCRGSLRFFMHPVCEYFYM